MEVLTRIHSQNTCSQHDEKPIDLTTTGRLQPQVSLMKEIPCSVIKKDNSSENHEQEQRYIQIPKKRQYISTENSSETCKQRNKRARLENLLDKVRGETSETQTLLTAQNTQENTPKFSNTQMKQNNSAPKINSKSKENDTFLQPNPAIFQHDLSRYLDSELHHRLSGVNDRNLSHFSRSGMLDPAASYCMPGVVQDQSQSQLAFLQYISQRGLNSFLPPSPPPPPPPQFDPNGLINALQQHQALYLKYFQDLIMNVQKNNIYETQARQYRDERKISHQNIDDKNTDYKGHFNKICGLNLDGKFSDLNWNLPGRPDIQSGLSQGIPNRASPTSLPTNNSKCNQCPTRSLERFSSLKDESCDSLNSTLFNTTLQRQDSKVEMGPNIFIFH